MPMPINNIEEYDKITEVVWYTPEKGRNEITSVPLLNETKYTDLYVQIPSRLPIFADVPHVLH